MSKAIEQITPTRRGALGALAASVAGVSIAACAVATSEAAAIGENDARLRAIYAAWLASWRKSEADDARHDAIVREVVPADILAERERRSAMIKADPAGYFDTLEDFKARSLPHFDRVRRRFDIDAAHEASSAARSALEMEALSIPADTLAGVLVKARIMACVAFDCVAGELPTDGAYEPDAINDGDILASIFADIARLGGEG